MLKSVTLLIALGMTPAFAQKHWTPDDAAIRRLERAVETTDWTMVLVKTAPKPLDGYDRFYGGEIIGGHHIIKGVFMDGKGSIHVLASPAGLPMILDGGCHVVSVTYDADTGTLERVACNGFG